MNKRCLIGAYVKNSNPYESRANTDYRFDFRGYANYLKENKLSGKDVSVDVVRRFQHGNATKS